MKTGSSGKEKSVLVCPKCLKPYRPDKTLTNLFGIAPFGFTCKNCGFTGAGPIKLVKGGKR